MVKGFCLDFRFPVAVLLTACAGIALAAESPQTTTLAPVHVHASDTAVLGTSSVTPRSARSLLHVGDLLLSNS